MTASAYPTERRKKPEYWPIISGYTPKFQVSWYPCPSEPVCRLTGSLGQGYQLTWNFGVYPEMIGQYSGFFLRSVGYALAVTALCLLI
ncbi:MAG TPA: hypothetical protein VHK28_01165, partial [Candidatus Limnocylindria bacterium]|nr:hypothetical protein [Candidatus Limnocylindria bacterium]